MYFLWIITFEEGASDEYPGYSDKSLFLPFTSQHIAAPGVAYGQYCVGFMKEWSPCYLWLILLHCVITGIIHCSCSILIQLQVETMKEDSFLHDIIIQLFPFPLDLLVNIMGCKWALTKSKHVNFCSKYFIQETSQGCTLHSISNESILHTFPWQNHRCRTDHNKIALWRQLPSRRGYWTRSEVRIPRYTTLFVKFSFPCR